MMMFCASGKRTFFFFGVAEDVEDSNINNLNKERSIKRKGKVLRLVLLLKIFKLVFKN
jgi:hypothetical protein